MLRFMPNFKFWSAKMGLCKQMAEKVSQLYHGGSWCMRISLFVIVAWIGALKFVDYQARNIVPLFAHSPLGEFLYADASHYKAHLKSTLEDRTWHAKNHTYSVAKMIGTLELILATLVLLGLWFPLAGIFGGLLIAGMGLVTLSFLITSPGIWMPNLGFPYLSVGGQSLLKNLLLLTSGLILAGLDAQRWLDGEGAYPPPQPNSRCRHERKGCCG